MDKKKNIARTNPDRITFNEFFPCFLKSFRIVMRTLRAIQTTKKLKPDVCMSLGTVVEDNAEKYAHYTALLFESEKVSYREFNEQANRFANYFLALGARKGDLAVILLENRPELLFCIAGLAKIGVITSLVNPNLRGAVLGHCLTIKPARHFIIDEGLVEAFEEIRPSIPIDPASKIFFSVNRGEKKALPGYIDLRSKLNGAAVTNPATTPTIQIQDPLFYIFTSGTTGKPKAVIYEHSKWLFSKYANGAEMGYNPGDVIYIPLPFNHGTALISWASAMDRGATVLMRRKFSVSNFWKDVKAHQAIAFSYIGEMCRYLMNQPPKADDNKNPVKKIIGNGLRDDIWRAFKKRFGISEVYEFYASSEGNVAFSNLFNLDCTIGLTFSPHALMKYDVETDQPFRDDRGFMQRVAKGEPGLLLGEITEDNRFVGYTNGEATEQKIFRDVFKKGDAWFNTGDLVKKIGFGQAKFVDRLGDTFRWKGENVSTMEVEEMISRSKQVKEAMVYGVKIPGTEGRAGMVSLISNTDLEHFDLKGFAGAVRRDLPPYAVPLFLRFQGSFEMTSTLKRIKSKLKQEGFNPQEVKDPLYVLLPGEVEYAALTKKLYTEILNGKFRF